GSQSKGSEFLHAKLSVSKRESSVGTSGPLHSKPRIDSEIEQVDDEVDDDEDQRDQAKIGGHDRNVGEGHGLDEEQAHAGPLEHRLRDDRKSDERTQLQAGDRDHGNERVLESMTEIDGSIRKAARACELDVVGAQDLEHLRADETHDERELEHGQGDGGQDQVL